MEDRPADMAPVHVLVFPWPLQGHINSMLPFAAGLLGAGVHVTFLHTEHNLRRVDRAASPRLRFASVPDGLPDDHPRSVAHLSEIGRSLRPSASAAYRALLAPALSAGSHADGGFPPVSCVVVDGLLPFAIDIAEELGVPALAFRTESACSILAYLSVPGLVELGEVPVPVGADLDEPVRGVPGMEGFLRRRDLPSSCRGHGEVDELDPMLQVLDDEYTAHSCTARALIFNTTASLERSALAHIAPHMRDVFAIGPLHAMSAAPASATSLWREDDGCMAWLDGHADRSVVYVSLGSLAIISREQFTEFLSGLVGAGYAFLWAFRSDMVGASQSAALQEAVDAAGKRKVRVVDWAPQRDVLRHRAVGCFLTHAGWNSTLEGIVEGVPLVCWPFFADQQINSRFTAAVWGTGLDMKDVCERAVVERMVREAMESGELRRSAQALSQQVRRDIAQGGSSVSEFERLVKFIKELTANGAHK
ncbi:myricetin 3-O-rhamnoside 1,2-glucosyltransferase UGT709G2-like [Triticum aestivum]|uniref:myricetin 3-O-rhamnoside 1,2-glucosyltransferase UGT709G2-like n=1 Tax=Triticum aestivum TaxID=4565 RepID=UPI001D007BDA|nr:myricetin 3-O-rhamnoside 1,2-glucosyltransferase UGT709G2-like [Triticum aestivum]